MRGECKKLSLVFVAVLVLLLNVENGVLAQPQVPCYFIFGDSLVDNGNNNNLNSLAKANYLPYGIDFPRGPTGRFSNGKTTVDVISEFSTIILLNFSLLTLSVTSFVLHYLLYVLSKYIN